MFLQTFGVPALRGEEEEELRLNAKELALLVYLRVTGRPHTRGAIGQLLWGTTAHGRNNSVNTAISALRRRLPPGALPPGADPVALRADLPCDVDAVLTAASGAGGREQLMEALRTHRAPFLDGFEFQLGEGAGEFIAWIGERRAAFESALVEALEEQLAGAAAAGDRAGVHVLARAGREALPGWGGGAEWAGRANRTRSRSRLSAGAAVLTACAVAFLLLMPRGGSGSARTCSPGEARAQLVRQVYPAEANQAVRAGERYTPAWYLKNVGRCAWRPGVRVSRVRAFGPASLSADTTPRTIRYRVQPGEEVKVEIRTRGPAHTGEYGEDWVVRDAYGKPVAMVGGATLQIRFQVLPPAVPACGPGQVVADLLGESHPLPNTRVGPGEPLPVSWTLFNRGTCAWDSAVSLRFRQASGSRMSDPSLSTLPLGEAVPPTEAHTFHVPMRAPRADGSYREEWELVGPGGQVVRVSDGDGVDVRVVVSRTDEARAAEPECAPGEEVVAFMRSETVRDGSSIAPGAHVAKEWTLQNAGPCTWPAGALRLAPVASPAWVPARPLPRPVSDRPVPPKGTYTFRAPFTAPAAPGYYRVHWRMYNRAGAAVMMSQTFTIWADFHVRGPQP